MVKCRFVIIGGGIVGLATARALQQRFPDCVVRVLEKESKTAFHQTGHNSGVIHAGLYYKPGSLKAKLCVAGSHEIVHFCQSHQLRYKITGKIVVATHANELPRLEELYRRGQANGIQGIEKIGPEQLKEYEPHAAGIQALWVPVTGIVDYVAISEKLKELMVADGGQWSSKTKVFSAKRIKDEWAIETSRGVFKADYLVNCSGLFTDRLAKACGFHPEAQIVPFRGEYHQLKEEAHHLVKGLIYPVPDPSFPFLGVHFTRLVNGGVEAGPNAVWAWKREGYRKTDVSLKDMTEAMLYPGFVKLSLKYWKMGIIESYRSWCKQSFVKALQRLVPAIESKHLQRGGAGVRAQALDPTGALVDDFRLLQDGHATHVLNAPSPAATASMPIGRYIADQIAATMRP